MNDWIANMEGDAKNRERENEIEAHRIKTLNALAPVIWERVYAQVQRDIERLQGIRTLRFIKLIFHNFRVRRVDAYPHVELLAEFLEGAVLKLVYSYKATSTTPTVNWSEVVLIKAAENDWNLTCGTETFLDEREASRFLLRPLSDTRFTPPENASI